MLTGRSRCTRPLALVALLGVLLLTGCSDSDDSSAGPTSSTASGTGATPPGCPPVREVDAVLRAELDDPEDEVRGATRTCTYSGPPGGDDVVVAFTTDVSASAFEDAATSDGDGSSWTPVTGLGDAAYSTTSGEQGDEVTTLVVLSGTTEVSVRAPVPLAQVEELAQRLVSAPS
jgi:hypothetical protein